MLALVDTHTREVVEVRLDGAVTPRERTWFVVVDLPATWGGLAEFVALCGGKADRASIPDGLLPTGEILRLAGVSDA